MLTLLALSERTNRSEKLALERKYCFTVFKVAVANVKPLQVVQWYLWLLHLWRWIIVTGIKFSITYRYKVTILAYKKGDIMWVVSRVLCALETQYSWVWSLEIEIPLRRCKMECYRFPRNIVVNRYNAIIHYSYNSSYIFIYLAFC